MGDQSQQYTSQRSYENSRDLARMEEREMMQTLLTTRKRIELHPSTWLITIVAMWIVILSVPQIEKVLPGSWWFTVESVHVHDTPQGTAPRMTVIRTIHRDFTARWVAEVEQETVFGFVVIPDCTAGEKQNYRTENALPSNLDLDWWTFPKKCRPEPGRYRVDTSWTLTSGQVVRAVSNVFTIY